MSDELDPSETALIEAVQQRLAALYPGALVDGFVLQASGRALDDFGADGTNGRSKYFSVVQPGQTWTTTLGLIEILRIDTRAVYSATGDD